MFRNKSRRRSSPESELPPQKSFGKKIKPFIKFFVIAVIFFGLGWAVGNDKLHIISVGGLSNQNKNLPADLDYKSVEQLYDLLRQKYDGKLDEAKLLEGLRSGLVTAANDPYTEYFNPKDAKELNEQLTGSFPGIGAELGTDADKNIIVVSPLSGYPAEKAGLKAQDIIVGINGQSTSGMTVSNAVRKIRGPVNTTVTLTIVRGNGSPTDIKIKRTLITVPSVKSSVVKDVGIIRINQFTTDTPALARQAAQNLKNQNVKGIILDLRGNPGGYLSAAVDVSSLWLKKGQVVVSERRGNDTISTETAEGGNILAGIPTIVLINKGSASASEIVAGALHDNKAARLLGEKSFGKGSVQQVEDLTDGSELKVTIARWYTPSGKNIDKEGINPDISAKAQSGDSSGSKDSVQNKALLLLGAK